MRVDKKTIINKVLLVLTTWFLVSTFPGLVAADLTIGSKSHDQLKTEQRVRAELARLSNYSAFDLIEFQVDDSVVTLSGYVSRPTLKKDSERAVLRLEEIEEVNNQIEVLPASRADDVIRYQTYSSIYLHPSLTRYAPGGQMTPMDFRRFRDETYFGLQSALQPMGPHPIHIIVKNGQVKLYGSVARESERSIAGIIANSIPGVFSVVNKIQAS